MFDKFLLCRLINEDILLLFLTIFTRNKTEMHANRHIVDVICMYIFKSFIRRSYRYSYFNTH